jgi:hypothetical protein
MNPVPVCRSRTWTAPSIIQTPKWSPDSRKGHAETYRVVLLADAAEVPVVLRLHELLSRLAALEHQFLQQRTTRISSM